MGTNSLQQGQAQQGLLSLPMSERAGRLRVQLVGELLLELLVRGSNPSGVGLLLESVVRGWDPTCLIRVHSSVDTGKYTAARSAS